MACLDAETVLGWLDGRLSSTRAIDVETHIDGCASCRRVISEAASSDDEPAPEVVPDRLGPYELRGLVGRGGMGEVYRAYDPRLDREVAIKLIRPHHTRPLRADDLDWFERETRAAAAIAHANVLSVFDVGRHGTVPYVVTELLVGESLRARLKRGAIGVRQAVPWARDLAHGMAAAHERSIVHRDIKPDNVFVTSDGRVKILDFGVAKLARHDEEPGLVVGTLGYMAPEQLRGEPVDHRTDIFAFGAVLYEMLTGEQAFRGKGEIELAEAALDEDPLERAAETLTQVPWPVVQVVRRCLEKAPSARFQSANDLAFALDMLGTDVSRREPAAPRRRRWPWIAAGVTAVVATAAIVIVQRWPEPAPQVVAPPPRPIVTRLLEDSGQILGVRETPRGTIVNVAFGDGIGLAGFDALRLVTRAPDGTLVQIPNTAGLVLAASTPEGLLALRAPRASSYRITGTLERITHDGRALPLAGDLTDVVAADQRSDGSLAVIRLRGDRYQVEAPLGTIVHTAQTWLWSLRAGPGGAIAFLEAQTPHLRGPAVVRIVRDGSVQRVLELRSAGSLAWDGDDLLVTGSRETEHGLYRIRGGAIEQLWTAAHPLAIHDVTGGSVIVSEGELAGRVFARGPDGGRDREIVRDERSLLVDLSLDGAQASLMRPVTTGVDIAVVGLAGGDPTVVATGLGGVLDRDGTTVLAQSPAPPWRIIATKFAPATPGKRELPVGEIETLFAAGWGANGDVVILASGPRGKSVYVQRADAPPRRTGPWPGGDHSLFRVSPDGKYIGALDREGNPALIDVETLAVRSLVDRPGDSIVGWSTASDAVWLARVDGWPIEVTRYPLVGKPRPLLTIDGPIAGALWPSAVRVAGDGKTCVYAFPAMQSWLYRIDGVLR